MILNGYVHISKKTLEYSRQAANFFPGYDHIADPFIEQSDYGMKAADVSRVFAELRQELVPMVFRDYLTGTTLTMRACTNTFPKKNNSRSAWKSLSSSATT